MQTWKRVLLILLGTLVGVALVVLAGGIVLTDFIVNYWWHDELNYKEFFWLKLLYRYILSGGVTIFFFLVFFLNFWAAARFLDSGSEGMDRLGRSERSRYFGFIDKLQSGSLVVNSVLSLLLAILIAIPFYNHWHEALLFLFAPPAGITDPVFNNDVGFYLFSYPVFQLIQNELLAAFIVLTIAIGIMYGLQHQLMPDRVKFWPAGTKLHMTALTLVTALIWAWGFMLDRFELLYTDAHEPQFFGPGFVDIRYYLPLIWGAIGTLLLTVLGALFFLHTGRGLIPTAVLGVLFLVMLGARQIDAIPEAISRFIVRPNPVKTERAFMQNNIDATLQAYDLNDVKIIDMVPGMPDEDVLDPELRTHLYNIPVWDPEFLDDVYQQLQGIRPYYRFSHVDVARYRINGKLSQVNLAAREVNIGPLPPAAKNWENTFLRYTHGFGAVITPAAQSGETPMNWYLRDLNLQSDVGFSIAKPDIYFGEEDLTYALVPNNLNIVGIPSFDEESSFNYTGRGGVPITSLFRKLLFALYFRDENLFFSVNIRSNSRALFHRNIVERVKQLTPFIHLDHDPYIVVTPQRIFWMLDAYTVSNLYPASKRTAMNFNREPDSQQINYIRNSVKIVIDAFDGAVDYYVTDPRDPIVQGYRRAFPGLFKDLAAMPPALQEEIRYPNDMFTTQMKLYARYHQAVPELFYEQAETWDFAKVNDSIMKPFFFTAKMEGYRNEEPSFILINPMTPVGRSNLSVLAVAGTPTTGNAMDGGKGYSRQIMLYRFSTNVQVDGPAQVSALIDQDPEISRQFALWDQKGSHVLRGRIIVIPVGHSVLYVQPVYLASTSGTRIPELQRIILSMGNVATMDANLDQGIIKLEQRLRDLKRRALNNRPAPPPAANPQGPSVRSQP